MLNNNIGYNLYTRNTIPTLPTLQNRKINPIVPKKTIDEALEKPTTNKTNQKQIDKTLKHEKQKLEQHQHVQKLFRNNFKPNSISRCSSCSRR